MILSLAVTVVIVLLAVALLPVKKREPDTFKQANPIPFLAAESNQPIRQTTLRQQQLSEEATAVADEYQRRANDVWLEEVRVKASKLLSNSKAKPES